MVKQVLFCCRNERFSNYKILTSVVRLILTCSGQSLAATAVFLLLHEKKLHSLSILSPNQRFSGKENSWRRQNDHQTKPNSKKKEFVSEIIQQLQV